MMTLRLGILLQGFVAISVFLALVFCDLRRADAQFGGSRVSLPHDWSHHHVIFSSTRDIPLLLKIRQDPRLLHQWLKFNAHGGAVNRVAAEELPDQFEIGEPPAMRGHFSQNRADWSISLGTRHLTRSQYPAKFSFDLNAAPSCTNDFAVFPTGAAGNTTQATIVAFDQLYSGQGGVAPGICGSNGPSVKWSYNTGSAILTSPVLSLDGTKVAFVSRNPGTVHILTIGTTGNNGASVVAPVIPGTGNNAVDDRIALNGGRRVNSSSLFLDYPSDVGYVGDDGGVLHKITGVFQGVPAEVTTGGWPITVGAAALNDPVFDSVSGNVFTTDATGHLSYVRDVGSVTGTCAAGAPPCLGFPAIAVSAGGAIVDAPIIDTSTGRVFSETAANGGNAQIIQTDTALGSIVRVNVGLQDAANPLRNGDFDGNYLNDVATGFYYVCGKANNATLDPTLYRIGFNASGAMNPAPDVTTLRLARAAAQCSPITAFLNTGSGKQWLFVGVSTRCGASGGPGGGCIMSFDATAGMPAAATSFLSENNGTSGIIIDNVSTAAQASSIYFTNEGAVACGDGIATGGCAIKLTQSALR